METETEVELQRLVRDLDEQLKTERASRLELEEQLKLEKTDRIEAQVKQLSFCLSVSTLHDVSGTCSSSADAKPGPSFSCSKADG